MINSYLHGSLKIRETAQRCSTLLLVIQMMKIFTHSYKISSAIFFNFLELCQQSTMHRANIPYTKTILTIHLYYMSMFNSIHLRTQKKTIDAPSSDLYVHLSVPQYVRREPGRDRVHLFVDASWRDVVDWWQHLLPPIFRHELNWINLVVSCSKSSFMWWGFCYSSILRPCYPEDRLISAHHSNDIAPYFTHTHTYTFVLSIFTYSI